MTQIIDTSYMVGRVVHATRRKMTDLYQLRESREMPEEREPRLAAQKEHERRICVAMTLEQRQDLAQQRRKGYIRITSRNAE